MSVAITKLEVSRSEAILNFTRLSIVLLTILVSYTGHTAPLCRIVFDSTDLAYIEEKKSITSRANKLSLVRMNSPAKPECVIQWGGTCYIEAATQVLRNVISKDLGAPVSLSRKENYMQILSKRFESQMYPRSLVDFAKDYARYRIELNAYTAAVNKENLREPKKPSFETIVDSGDLEALFSEPLYVHEAKDSKFPKEILRDAVLWKAEIEQMLLPARTESAQVQASEDLHRVLGDLQSFITDSYRSLFKKIVERVNQKPMLILEKLNELEQLLEIEDPELDYLLINIEALIREDITAGDLIEAFSGFRIAYEASASQRLSLTKRERDKLSEIYLVAKDFLIWAEKEYTETKELVRKRISETYFEEQERDRSIVLNTQIESIDAFDQVGFKSYQIEVAIKKYAPESKEREQVFSDMKIALEKGIGIFLTIFHPYTFLTEATKTQQYAVLSYPNKLSKKQEDIIKRHEAYHALSVVGLVYDKENNVTYVEVEGSYRYEKSYYHRELIERKYFLDQIHSIKYVNTLE